MDEMNNKINNIYTTGNIEQKNYENNALVFGMSDSYFDN